MNCFVPEKSLKDAKARLQEALTEDRYKLIRIEWYGEHSNIEWEAPDDAEEHDALARQALESDDVVYGTFYGYDAN